MGVTDLPDDLQQKLGKWEANKPENRSVRALEDIASMVQEALSVLGEKPDSTREKEMGAILVDMRESLAAIKNKDYPKMPDYSKPLLAGLEKLEKAFTKIDVRPEFRPNIQVDSPAVTVEASKVDLKGVEKVLKKDIPEAFREAVKLIPVSPAVELTPLENLLREMSEQLSSIDTASRLKPQFPTTLKVTNPDGSNVGSIGKLVPERFDYVAYTNTSSTVDTYTYRTGGQGGQIVATVVIAYTDTTKEQVSTVART